MLVSGIVVSFLVVVFFGGFASSNELPPTLAPWVPLNSQRCASIPPWKGCFETDLGSGTGRGGEIRGESIFPSAPWRMDYREPKDVGSYTSSQNGPRVSNRIVTFQIVRHFPLL